MKRVMLSVVLMSSSMTASAVAPGGPDCGWGNMVFEGQGGTGSHFVAMTTNTTSGNKTFGMTSGTNGCDTSGRLTYGGDAIVNLSGVIDEFIAVTARGEGEALTAVAVSMGIAPADRAIFADAVHNNFDTIFKHADVTAEDVMVSLVEVMKSNPELAKYVS